MQANRRCFTVLIIEAFNDEVMLEAGCEILWFFSLEPTNDHQLSLRLVEVGRSQLNFTIILFDFKITVIF